MTFFKDNRPGKNWYYRFLERHPCLSMRTAQNLTVQRAAATEPKIRALFKHTQEYLKKKNLLNIEPKRIYNLDESGFAIVPNSDKKVFAEKGCKGVHQIVSGSEKSQVTVLFIACANGECSPPLILFRGKKLPKNIKGIINEVPGVGLLV